MIDYKDFLNNPDKYFLTCQQRGGEKLLRLAKESYTKLKKIVAKSKLQALEKLQSEINLANKQMPSLGKAEKLAQIKKLKKLSNSIATLKNQVRDTEIEKNQIIKKLPNLILADVPIGKDESNNKVLRSVGERNQLTKPKDYLT